MAKRRIVELIEKIKGQIVELIQPEGFQINRHEEKVYKLKRSLYGLKQSSRQWYLKFHQAILKIGFEVSVTPKDFNMIIKNALISVNFSL